MGGCSGGGEYGAKMSTSLMDKWRTDWYPSAPVHGTCTTVTYPLESPPLQSTVNGPAGATGEPSSASLSTMPHLTAKAELVSPGARPSQTSNGKSQLWY